MRLVLTAILATLAAGQQRSPRCSLPIVIGTGLYRIPRWGYNANTGVCELFYYSGCCGNDNNFKTVGECESLCGGFPGPRSPCLVVEASARLEPCSEGSNCGSGRYCHVGGRAESTVCCPGDEPNRCRLPRLNGEGSETLSRFYFDSGDQSCRQFIYRGSRGNPNNFLSRESCETACGVNPCALGRALGDGAGEAVKCSPGVGGGSSSCPSTYWCHPGASSETTLCCPGAVADPCDLPVSTGTGGFQLERYYYDGSVCLPFIYQGLGGNQNNFINRGDCSRTCLKTYENPCVGEPAKYPSGAPIFCSLGNKDTCPVNFWCHIGNTPLTTLCCPGATNPCSVPLSPGRGKANLARFYYNADTRTCVRFQYNGLGGNQNNFVSQAECGRSCPEATAARSFRDPAPSPLGPEVSGRARRGARAGVHVARGCGGGVEREQRGGGLKWRERECMGDGEEAVTTPFNSCGAVHPTVSPIP